MKYDDRGVARNIVRVLAAVILLAGATISVLATASNLGFLKDAPLTRFTGPDLEMFQSNLNHALEQYPDGDIRQWENPNTGSSGEIAVVKSFTHDGKRCRRARISNRARGYAEAKTDAVFCKETDNLWKLLPPTKSAPTPASPAVRPGDP